jgi:MFS transporter, DHA2 family, multidrug resistance protein
MSKLGLSPEQALGAIDREINRQSYTLAATDLFWLAGILFLVLTALIWFSRPVSSNAGAADAAGAH